MIDLLIIAVIGSLFSIEGAWIGAFVFVVLQNYASRHHDVTVPWHRQAALRHDDRRHLPRHRAPRPGRADRHLGLGSSGSAGGRRRFASGGRGRARRAGSGTTAVDEPRERRQRRTDSRLVRASRTITTSSATQGVTTEREGNTDVIECGSALLVVGRARPSLPWPGRVGHGVDGLAGSTAASPIKIGILSDCKGAFGAQYDGRHRRAPRRRSSSTPVRSRRTRTSRPTGITGGAVAGHPLQIVGFGCSNDNAPTWRSSETKRLMEQLGAHILIGPLSGDEAVAVAHYAQAHPTKTFINGTARRRRTRRCRSRRRTSSATTVTARSGTPVSATSRTTSSTGGRPRSSWTTTASAGRPRPASSPTSARSAARSSSGCSRR